MIIPTPAENPSPGKGTGIRPGLRKRIVAAARYLAIVIAAFLVAVAAELLGWLQPFDDYYYDVWHLGAGQRQEARHSALIVVDDETLLQLKDDPLAFWAPHFAQAMETLSQAGVTAIGLDFIYTVSAEAWLRKLNLPDSEISRNYDAPLRAQLAAGNKILITHLVENAAGDLEFLLPPADHMLLLPQGLNDMGVANLYPDNDKIVRHFYPVVVPEPGFPGIGFSMQLALRAAGVDGTADSWSLAGTTYFRQRERFPIGYLGPPGTVPRVSMSRLLAPGALEDPQVKALKGRVVIIAANNTGTSDFHFSPYSRVGFGSSGESMIGGEIHAHIIETLLSGKRPRAISPWPQYVFIALLAMLAASLFLRLHPLKGLFAGTVLILVPLLPAYLLFLDYWVLKVAAGQAAISCAYLVTLGLRLTSEERQRSRLRAMFGQYVSDVVVDKLILEGMRPNLGGETVPVTVLFSDIRNFTTISERLDAQEVVEMLNAYFERACEPILAHGGMVNKFIGDAVMAVFGSPVRFPDHAQRALLAAREMVKVAEEFREWMKHRFPDRELPVFGIGIGVHSGVAVIGDIGSTRRREFTAIGDTVNTASRLESLTKEFGCVLVASAETVRQAGAGVVTGKTEAAHVKGKAEAVVVYEIRDVRPETDASAPSA